MPRGRCAAGDLGDLAHIPGLSPDEWRRLHSQDLEYLKATVRPGDVVVTHHSPSIEGLDPSMQHNPRLMPFASAYATNIEQVVQDLAPVLWVHGHTHVTTEYQIGSVPVVSNALGRGSGPHFNPHLVVEIGGHEPRPPR